MRFVGVRNVGGVDVRDHALVARYARADMQVDIGWNVGEVSIGVLLKYERSDLAKRDRYVYVEPLLECLSEGRTRAIVPYVRPGMNVRELGRIATERAFLFANGPDSVIAALAQKIRLVWRQIESVSSETIRCYHLWIRGGAMDSMAGGDAH